MLKLFTLVLLTIAAPVFGDNDPTDGTELVMTFLVHRHGDRTPVESTISFSTDPDALEELSAQYGYGQLTDVGKQTAYKLGEFIRSRYNELLSDKYNKSEIYIRSTDSTRAKMTVLSAMSAVYPAGDDNWSETVNWQPIPYTTVPVKYDFNMAEMNCPTFKTFYDSIFLASSSSMDKYFDVLNTWSSYVGFNLTQYPALAYSIYDVYTAQISMGLPLVDELAEIFPGIEAAAGGAIDFLFGDDDYIKLEAGVLLDEFFNVTTTAIDGQDTQRVRVYSAHDFNVFAFMAVSQITPRQGVPKYASFFALELRKVVETGNYVVLPVYLKDPKTGEFEYLQVDGCDDLLCDYDTFKEITADYVIEEDDWRTECGFTNDLVIDSSDVD